MLKAFVNCNFPFGPRLFDFILIIIIIFILFIFILVPLTDLRLFYFYELILRRTVFHHLLLRA